MSFFLLGPAHKSIHGSCFKNGLVPSAFLILRRLWRQSIMCCLGGWHSGTRRFGLITPTRNEGQTLKNRSVTNPCYWEFIDFIPRRYMTPGRLIMGGRLHKSILIRSRYKNTFFPLKYHIFGTPQGPNNELSPVKQTLLGGYFPWDKAFQLNSTNATRMPGRHMVLKLIQPSNR